MKYWRLLGIMLLVWLVGIVPCSAAKTKIVHLRPRNVGPQSTQWLEKIAEEYEALNPDIEVDIYYAGSTAELIQQVLLQFASGVAPDVVEIAAEDGYPLATQNIFANLSPIIAGDKNIDIQELYPVAVQAATMTEGANAGNFWFLPHVVNTSIMVLNDDMFHEAGIQPPSQWNYQWTSDDFVDICKKLTIYDGDGQIIRYGANVPNFYNRFPLWVHNAGGWYFDRLFNPRESRLTTEPVHTALSFLQDIYHTHRVAHWLNGNILNNTAAIALGLPTFKAGYDAAKCFFAYSFALNPKLVRGANIVQVQGLALTQNSPNAEAAYKWIKYVALERALEHQAATGFISTWKKISMRYPDKFWFSVLNDDQNIPRPVYDLDIRNELQKYVNAITQDQKPVAPTLQQAHEVLNNLLKEKASR